tara:strand:+ start:2701 stop:3087 length:387 start_codon:yes stop_codon:yes gene_type:complete
MADARYRDLDLDFTPHPTTTDVSMKTNSEAVKRSVRNLVLLNTYEKPFHPEIGSGVRDLLFEPATPLTAVRIKRAIEEVIDNFEPRADLLGVNVGLEVDRNAFAVSIEFRIRNMEQPESLSFSLERLR